MADKRGEDEFIREIFETAIGRFFAELDGSSLFDIADAARSRAAGQPSID